MSETESAVIGIITGVLADKREGVQVTADSAMGNPAEWDSLAFVEIFTTVSSHFGLAVSDDDAINFMSVPEIVAFVDANR